MVTLADFITQLMVLVAQFASQFFGQNTYVASPSCNFNQNMANGVIYNITNKEYPNNYGAWQSCKWTLTAQSGMQINFNCSTNLAGSSDCSGDKLMVSTVGDPTLKASTTYCGQGNLTVMSTYSNMTMGFRSTFFTSGGTFTCTATTVPMSTTTSTTTPSTTTSTTTTTASTTTSTITASTTDPTTTAPISTATLVVPTTAGPCNCGWKNTNRIVGGIPTLTNEYPSMAGLYDLLIQDIYCGATIISTRYAVTAAHCVTNKQATAVALIVGAQNISSVGTGGSQLILLTSFIRHPNYNDSDPIMQNDIALVRTSTDIVFTNTIGPVCLPFNFVSNLFTGETAMFTGWGTTVFTGPKSDTLLKTDVTVLDPSNCTTATGATNNQICTFKAGHDACQADSGGPLYWTDPSTYKDQLIGIISYGMACGGSTPGVNTRVTSYLSWILQSATDAAYCVS